MKLVIEIAKAELKRIFYSPVAWLVLVAFGFQVCYIFVGKLSLTLKIGEMNGYQGITDGFFLSTTFSGALLRDLQNSFYLYVPLLTMNMLSRDFSSGTIKLLYSSPIDNAQIILGKYLSLVIFGLIMIGIIALPVFYTAFHIQNAEWLLVLNGLLGLFLLLCSYAVIGLFMSSLTTYPIIAVIATFAVLGFLNEVGDLGQDIPVLRDLTYWFSINGRSGIFIKGLISTESVLYFISVIGFFLSLAIIRLNAKRGKQSGAGKNYLAVVLLTAVIGYCSSLPVLIFYWDLTRSKTNTISKESQQIVKKLDGGLTITSYSNMLDEETSGLALPAQYKNNVARFDTYVRFKPEIKLDYKYYYQFAPSDFFNKRYPGLTPERILDSLSDINEWDFPIHPAEKFQKEADLAAEDYRLVHLIERENGRKTYLRIYDDFKRYPSEMQISAALKRLVEDLPVVGFVTGHGERSIDSRSDNGYNFFTSKKSFRYSLVNNGFDVENVSLANPVPANVRILVVADAKQPFTANELANFQDYVNKGGNLLLLTDLNRQASMGSLLHPLGVQAIPGVLMQPKKHSVAEVIYSPPTPYIDSLSYLQEGISRLSRTGLVMNKTVGLKYVTNAGFNVLPIFRTDTATWNELETTDLINDSAVFNPVAGESLLSCATVLSLSRNVNNKQQKIIISGDADWLSNSELKIKRTGVRAQNFLFIFTVFNYLSDGELPVDMRRAPPTDNSLSLSADYWKKISPLFAYGIPAMLLIAAFWILIRRRGR